MTQDLCAYLYIARDCQMKQFQKRFIKEVIAKVTILCAPIMGPLAFLGSIRTRRVPDDHIAAAWLD
jgi:hypothetical protein